MISIFGDGSQIRDLNHVEDVVDALLRAGSRDGNGEVYNLGGAPISLLELAEKLISLAGAGRFQTVPFPAARRAIDIGNYYGNYQKISRDLGWTPTTSLDSGLLDSLDYFRRHFAPYCAPEPIRRKA